MKIIWVSLLLVGLCLAKEEEVADDLQEIEGRRLEVRQPKWEALRNMLTRGSVPAMMQRGAVLIHCLAWSSLFSSGALFSIQL